MAVDVNKYKNNREAAIKEIIRAKEVYTAKKAAGDTAGAEAASKWATNVRNISGVSGAAYSAKADIATAKSAQAGNINPYITQPTQPSNITPAPGEVIDSAGIATAPNNASKDKGFVDTIVPDSGLPVAPVAPVAPSQTPSAEVPDIVALPDVTPQIIRMAEAQTQARQASFEEQKRQALESLRQEKAEVAPMYYNKRNEVAALSQQEQRNFAEFMAARGGSTSGISSQLEMGRSNALQRDVGSLNRDEAAVFADIARRGTEAGLSTDAARDEAIAVITAQKNQQLINQANTGFQQTLDAGALTGNLPGGVQTLQAKEFAERQVQNKFQNQLAADEAARQQRSLDTEISGIDPITGKPSAAEKWRQTNYDSAEAQRTIDNTRLDDAQSYQEQRDAVQDEQWGSQYQLQLDKAAWDKNENNPTVRAAILQNQIADLQLLQLPKVQALELKKLALDIATGKISNTEAKARIENLKVTKANIVANTANTIKNTKLMGTGGSSGGGGSRSSGGGSRSSGGSSSGSASSYSNYQDFKNELADKGGKALETLIMNPKEGRKNLGQYYNTAINKGQEKYSSQLKVSWGNSPPQDIISSLTGNTKYYRKMMGDGAYNTMLKKARKAKG